MVVASAFSEQVQEHKQRDDMTASFAFLGLTKIIVPETMCRFFLQKCLYGSRMTVPSVFWIQIYENISKL